MNMSYKLVVLVIKCVCVCYDMKMSHAQPTNMYNNFLKKLASNGIISLIFLNLLMIKLDALIVSKILLINKDDHERKFFSNK